MDDNNTSESFSSHQNSVEVIDHICDDNGKTILNREEEADVKLIHSINAANDKSMIDDDKLFFSMDHIMIHKIHRHNYLMIKMVHNIYEHYFGFNIKEVKYFLMAGIIVVFSSQQQEIGITYVPDQLTH